MHFALMELCPEGRGECFTREEKVWYMNVEFKDKSGFHEQQAEITVTGSSYDGPGSHDNRNLRRQLMIAAIAGAWERQSNDGKNCFTAPKDGWDETHCNIGYVIVIAC